MSPLIRWASGIVVVFFVLAIVLTIVFIYIYFCSIRQIAPTSGGGYMLRFI
jgi:hypothetical protein